MNTFKLDRLSIEVTNKCFKACSFCYNHSGPEKSTNWTTDDIIGFASDCADNGVKAISFGGGEPLQFEGIFDVLDRLQNRVFRSLTTNGLLLETYFDQLVKSAPNKIHLSIHFPDKTEEVHRVINGVTRLTQAGIRSGVNFLVRRSELDAAQAAAQIVRAAGIANDQIVYLPMRGQDTPTPAQVASVAGNKPFQSMSCLSACAASPRFCSIGWDKTVAWCSYTSTRARLERLSYQALYEALQGLGLEFCGGTQPEPGRTEFA